MRILLTRPEAESEQLALRLEREGHAVIISPVLDIVRRADIPAELEYDGVVAASARVFANKPAAASGTNWNAAPLYCVGENTAAAARHCGFAVIAAIAPSARELLPLISEHLPAPARLLYLAGQDRKPFLENGLRALGHDVQTIVTYEAAAAASLSAEAQSALVARRIDALLHFSRRSAEIFAQLAETSGLLEHASACRHVCISGDAAAGLSGLGAIQISIAETPDTQSMLAALKTTPG